MTFLVFLLLFAQFEPAYRLVFGRFQEQQKLQNSLIQAILSKDAALAETALKGNCDPNFQISLSGSDAQLLRMLSPRMHHYYVNGSDFRPLHIAAGLGEKRICRLLVANGAKQYTPSKGYEWLPAQYAAKSGYPDLAQLLLGLDPDDERYRIEISLASQRLTVFAKGLPYLTAGISTGRHDKPTPPGMYLVTDKIRLQRSTIYKVRMPYFLRLSFSEVGIHYGVNPGRPASHGCIRIGSEEKARKIFDACPIGTIVQIR
jgi:L,D-transpeptidase catalytic domain/Ankyrin repeats (3 copies)